MNTPTSVDENLKVLYSMFKTKIIKSRTSNEVSKEIQENINDIITLEMKELDIKGLDAIIESLKELEKC